MGGLTKISMLRRAPHLARAAVVLVAGLAATAFAWHLMNSAADTEARSEFEAQAGHIAEQITARMSDYEQVLWGSVALLAAAPDLSREQWHAYVEGLRIPERLPGVQGVGLIKRIRADDKASHILEMRAQGFPDYDIRPEGARDEYSAVVYLEPPSLANRRSIGQDMMTEPVPRAAMERARDMGEAALSGKVALVQDAAKGDRPGFLMYLPIYRNGAPAGTAEERRGALIGYVYSPFRVADLMSGMLAGLPAEIGIELYDGRETTSETLLYRSTALEEHAPGADRPDRVYATTLPIGNHPWTLRFVPLISSVGDIERNGGPYVVLAAGILISVLASWIVAALGLKGAEVAEANERLIADVARRKQIEAQLRDAEGLLSDAVNSVSEGFVIFDPEDRLVIANEKARQLYHESAARIVPGTSFEEILRYGLAKGEFADAVGREAEWLAERLRRHQEASGMVEQRLGDGRILLVAERRMKSGGIAGLRLDITALKAAEAARRQSDERLRDAIECIPDGFVIYDKDDRLVTYNQAYRKLFPDGAPYLVAGARFEDIMRGSLSRHRDLDPAAQAAQLAERLAQHRDVTGSSERWLPGGQCLLVTDRRMSDGGTAGLRIDITPLKAAEAARRDSEEMLRGAIECIPDGFVIYDKDERLVMCNEAYRALFPDSAPYLVPGSSFEALIRHTLTRRQNLDALGREEEWLAARLAEIRDPKGSSERWLADGRCLLVTERRMPNGGLAGLRVDITAIKRAELALQKSEQRFRDIAEVAADWIWESDEQHRLTFIAGEATKATGNDPNQFLGACRWEVAGADPESDERWRQHKADLDAHRIVKGFRYSTTDSSGQPLHLSISGKPVFDIAGVFLGYRGTATNETPIVDALQRAEQAETMLRDAIESIPDGFVIYDREDRLVMCNEGYRKLYAAYEHLIVPGARFAELIQASVEEHTGVATVGQEYEWLAERMRQHRSPAGAIEQRLADGRWVLVIEHPMSDGGIAGLRVDITTLKKAEAALRESEARLDRAQSIARIGSWELDLRSDQWSWSREMYRISGLAPGEPGEPAPLMTEQIHRKDLPRLAEWLDALKAGRERSLIEFRIFQASGAMRIVCGEGEPVRGEGGAIERIAGTMRDVTEVRAAEAARRVLEHRIQHSQKLEALGTLASGIAHDLNNALQPILALSQICLDRTPAPSEEREDLAMIHRASLRARDLVKQIVAFSRKRSVERKVFDAAAVAREALRLLRLTVPPIIRLEEEIADAPPLFGDPGDIHRVIVNLVTNAAQAIGQGAGTIRVTFALDDKAAPNGARTVSLAVRDTGCGMDQATLEHAFEPFFTTKQVGEGTGLGLSVVHGIVKSHNGTVEVESKPGAGTCVTVRLPVARDRDESAPVNERKSA